MVNISHVTAALLLNSLVLLLSGAPQRQKQQDDPVKTNVAEAECTVYVHAYCIYQH